MIGLLLNASPRDDDEVQAILEFAHDAVGIGRERVAVRVKTRRDGLGGGWAFDSEKHGRRVWTNGIRYGTSLNVVSDGNRDLGRPRACWHATQMRSWAREFGTERAFVECAILAAAGETKLGRWPIYRVDTWQEHLVHLAGHELAHILAFTRGRKATSEVWCEEVAARVLDEFRGLTNGTGLALIASTANTDPQEDPMTETAKHTSSTEENEVTLSDGSTLILPVHVVQREGETSPTRYETILVRTRTGSKVHRGSNGSSTTNCGVWLRVNGSEMRIVPSTVNRALLCESCFPVSSQPTSSNNSTTTTEEVSPMSTTAAPEAAQATPDPKEQQAAGRSSARTTATAAAAPQIDADLDKALLAQLKSALTKPEFKTAPSGSYTAVKVDGKPVGYLHPPTRKGVLVHLAISPAEAKKLGVKGAEAMAKGVVKTKVYVTKTEQVEKVTAAFKAAVPAK